MRRVAITGIGLLTAVGSDVDQTWKALLDGESGVGELTAFDPTGLETRLGAELTDFDASRYVSNRRTLRNMTRNDRLAMAGARLAVEDAGVEAATDDDPDGDLAALYLGGNKEISHPDRMREAALAFRGPDGEVDPARIGTEGAKLFYPLFYIEGLQAAALFYISQAFGLRGENTYFAGTAEAGATAIGRAFRAIRRGDARMALAGGWDDATSWWHTGKLDAMGGLTRADHLGSAACRPFDRRRDGAVLGEGAAFLVLEEATAARDRGATVYAEVVGFGAGLESDDLITPAPDGHGLVHAARRALADAELTPADIDYVAAHGSGTVSGDAGEAAAYRTVFAPEVVPRPVTAGGVKPATGHLVAGSGALNAAVAALAVRYGQVPPTLNLDDPDPACAGMDWVRGANRRMEVRNALAVARGLHGQNVVLAIGRADGTVDGSSGNGGTGGTGGSDERSE